MLFSTPPPFTRNLKGVQVCKRKAIELESIPWLLCRSCCPSYFLLTFLEFHSSYGNHSVTTICNEFLLCRRTYTVADVVHELEESGHFTPGNVFIAPPNAGDGISDEDSGDEDGGTINNLSQRQLLAASVATTFERGERWDIGNTDSEEEDISDIEIPPKRQKLATSKAHQQQQQSMKWLKSDLPSSSSSHYQWSVEKPAFLCYEWSPVSMFELLFDDEVIDLIATYKACWADE